MRGRLAALAVLDLAVWLLVVWLVTAPADVPLRRRLWHDSARAFRAAASYCGRQAIESERRYWIEVNKS